MKRALRIITIIFLALTIVFTVTGGAGTACVAWNADTLGGKHVKNGSGHAPVEDPGGIVHCCGLWGIYSTIRLSKGKPGGWIYTVIFCWQEQLPPEFSIISLQPCAAVRHQFHAVVMSLCLHC
jgi:hypothetical protein